MEIIKKGSSLLLATSMLIGGVFVANLGNSYAAEKTDNLASLKIGTVYKYDLDGDGDKDSVKIYQNSNKLLLKVNNKNLTLVSNYDKDNDEVDVKVYDFNKNDKTLDIVSTVAEAAYNETRIVKFQNNQCKVNKLYKDAYIDTYNDSTGMITLNECFLGRYGKFYNAIGCFNCYDKVRVDGYSLKNQFTANTTSDVKENNYVVAKTLTAYTDKTNNKVKFTVSKGDKVNIYALYQKNNNTYLKVKNAQGAYGYIKADLSNSSVDSQGYPKGLIFTAESCLWFR